MVNRSAFVLLILHSIKILANSSNCQSQPDRFALPKAWSRLRRPTETTTQAVQPIPPAEEPNPPTAPPRVVISTPLPV